ncbi:MAG: hypothetical protein JWO13_3605 [Acidobacteriales bacterium]|nr:hypothetical protein [Terriglobales bacterium]
MSRHFEVALEQVTQAVYEVWAESSEEAEEIATKLAMGREKPLLLLYSDVTCCCADEIKLQQRWKDTQQHAA